MQHNTALSLRCGCRVLVADQGKVFGGFIRKCDQASQYLAWATEAETLVEARHYEREALRHALSHVAV
ncbi:hypothetical protein ACTMTF_15280 [Nonomuraea sp. ZG12]|uniref:hypothetical protein n=1 Tax=Nonomuraea sp. ZG12 TaxID=3452207 RepID=UPI003F89C97B